MRFQYACSVDTSCYELLHTSVTIMCVCVNTPLLTVVVLLEELIRFLNAVCRSCPQF